MEDRGFVGQVFDLSFSSFVTIRVVRVLFAFQILMAAIATFTFLLRGFAGGFFSGLMALIVSPVVFFLIVLVARLICELTMVIFKIGENTSALVEGKES